MNCGFAWPVLRRDMHISLFFSRLHSIVFCHHGAVFFLPGWKDSSHPLKIYIETGYLNPHRGGQHGVFFISVLLLHFPLHGFYIVKFSMRIAKMPLQLRSYKSTARQETGLTSFTSDHILKNSRPCFVSVNHPLAKYCHFLFNSLCFLPLTRNVGNPTCFCLLHPYWLWPLIETWVFLSSERATKSFIY